MRFKNLEPFTTDNQVLFASGSMVLKKLLKMKGATNEL